MLSLSTGPRLSGLSSVRRPLNWYRAMEANRKWSSSRPNRKVSAAAPSGIPSLRFDQPQFSLRPPGAGSCADGDGGPRPGSAAVSLQGDGGQGEDNPLKRSPLTDERKPGAFLFLDPQSEQGTHRGMRTLDADGQTGRDQPHPDWMAAAGPGEGQTVNGEEAAEKTKYDDVVGCSLYLFIVFKIHLEIKERAIYLYIYFRAISGHEKKTAKIS